MPRSSAGLLLFRHRGDQKEAFLVHPGGPFWSKKDDGAWTIPKGEIEAGEDPLRAAQREFTEETGFTVEGPYHPLGTIKQSGGKVVHAFAVEADVDPTKLVSNTFQMEWPPKSGRVAEFPEADRAAWFPLSIAATKINPAQREFLERLDSACSG